MTFPLNVGISKVSGYFFQALFYNWSVAVFYFIFFYILFRSCFVTFLYISESMFLMKENAVFFLRFSLDYLDNCARVAG